MIEELNIGDFDVNIEFDISMPESGFDNRYKAVKISKECPASKLKYSNAEKLAKSLKFDKNIRYDCIVSGNFIFGDFIEAFIVENNAKCKTMTISTLSLDQNNVDSLANLIKAGYVEELNMIVSDYFYAHERGSIIPYMYEHLDVEDRFQLAAAGVHTKICMFETTGGKKIVIHGSANLRSSSNIEQFTIEENKSLYDFYFEYHSAIIERYKTINKDVKKHKSLRGKKLWEAVKS